MSSLHNNMILTRFGAPSPTPPGPTPPPPTPPPPTPPPSSYLIEKSIHFAGGVGYSNEDNTTLSPLTGGTNPNPLMELTGANTGNGTTKFTLSFWIKFNRQGLDNSYSYILQQYADGDYIYFFNNQLTIVADPYFSRSEFVQISFYPLFVDPTAWKHLVIAVDTTLGTAADRVKAWCNGREIFYNTLFTTVNQNQTFSFYKGDLTLGNAGGTKQFQLADLKFVDNQYLAETDFGQYSSTTGAWEPIAYTFTNSANDNSWALDFSDTASSSATDVGADSSGNGLNWTPYSMAIADATDNSYSYHFANVAYSVARAYIDIGSASNLDIGYNTPWTLECWVYVEELGSANFTIFGNDDIAYPGDRCDLKIGYNSSHYLFASLNADWFGVDTVGTNMENNTWHHIAVTWDGQGGFGVLQMWLNGTLVNTSGNPPGGFLGTFGFNRGASRIGARLGSDYSGNILISDLRLVSGTQIYTTNFTPPTTKLTAVTGTELLTCQDSTIVDNSGNGIGLTVTGPVVVRGNSPYEVDFSNHATVDTPTDSTTSSTGAGYLVQSNYPQWYNTWSSWGQNAHYIAQIDDNSQRRTPLLTSKSFSTGSWYWEFQIIETDHYDSTYDVMVGIAADPNSIITKSGGATDFSTATTPYSHFVSSDGYFYDNGVSTANSTSWYNGTIIGVAVDYDNTITFTKNGVVIGSARTIETGQEWLPIALLSGPNDTSFTPLYYKINFGQLPFEFSAPALAGGFYDVLCDKNLPTPTIVKSTDYFGTLAWEGNGTSQSITGLSFDPGLVITVKKNYGTWVGYDTTGKRHVYDTIRGAQNALFTNTNDANTSATTALTSFTTGGFNVGADTDVNDSAGHHYAMCWATAASSSSNTNGSITSTTRANQTSGTSVLTYTGSGSNGTVGHGLSVAPSMVLVKDQSFADSWKVWHKDIAATDFLGLDNWYDNPFTDATLWNSTAPTSSVFSVGTSASTNFPGDTYTAICFAEVEGFSKAGKYTGESTGSGDRRKRIYLGFKPEVIWIKQISGTANSGTTVGTYWTAWCGERNIVFDPSGSNIPSDPGFYPVMEGFDFLGPTDTPSNNRTYDGIEVLQNGFVIKPSSDEMHAYDGREYIYFAWAKAPEKYARSGL